MSLTSLPELDYDILYQLDYKDLYNTCLSTHYLHQYCLNNNILRLRLKAYILYIQLTNYNKIEFVDVNYEILDKYSDYKLQIYYKDKFKFKISISLKYDINYILYYPNIKPNFYGYHIFGGGPVSINKKY